MKNKYIFLLLIFFMTSCNSAMNTQTTPSNTDRLIIESSERVQKESHVVSSNNITGTRMSSDNSGENDGKENDTIQTIAAPAFVSEPIEELTYQPDAENIGYFIEVGDLIIEQMESPVISLEITASGYPEIISLPAMPPAEGEPIPHLELGELTEEFIPLHFDLPDGFQTINTMQNCDESRYRLFKQGLEYHLIMRYEYTLAKRGITREFAYHGLSTMEIGGYTVYYRIFDDIDGYAVLNFEKDDILYNVSGPLIEDLILLFESITTRPRYIYDE